MVTLVTLKVTLVTLRTTASVTQKSRNPPTKRQSVTLVTLVTLNPPYLRF